MFDRVLLPLDGSSLSEAIIPYVIHLAKGLKCTVTVLYVSEPADGGYVHCVPGGERLRAAEYLGGTAQRFTEEHIPVSTKALAGRPAQEIASAASNGEFDLIAMSTHGRSGTAQWVYGSTTDKVLQTIVAPVFLLRSQGGDEPMAGQAAFKTLIVPLDGSTLAESVLRPAKGLAKALGLSIALVRVAPSEEAVMAFTGPDFFEETQFTAILSRAEAYLNEQAGALRGEGFTVTTTVAEGYAPDQIIEIAKRMDHSLLLMSTHGGGGTGRWAMGSVTDRVMRASPRPVLVLRP